MKYILRDLEVIAISETKLTVFGIFYDFGELKSSENIWKIPIYQACSPNVVVNSSG